MAVIDEINKTKQFVSDAYGIAEEKGATIPDKKNLENLADCLGTIETGGGEVEKIFTGHVDVEGLKAIGWDDEDIEYFQKNGIAWNENEDNYFKLSSEEITGPVVNTTTRFLPKSSTLTSFRNYTALIAIPKIDTSTKTGIDNMFRECANLRSVPLLNTSSAKSMTYAFYNCNNLEKIPLLNTSNVTNMSYAFYYCRSLMTIPLLDTSRITNMNSTFNGAGIIAFPKIDTKSVTSMNYMFNSCKRLYSLPELDADSVVDVSGFASGDTSLIAFGGLKNLGKAYSTTASANFSNYKLNLSDCKLLTHDSLMNVINNLYDIASKGCNIQTLQLGDSNLAKLTEEEKAIATNKGWTLL